MKARAKVRKLVRSRRIAPPRNLGTGGFTIIRQQPTIWLSNSNVVGSPLVRGGQGTTSLALGTPEPNPIFGNVYSIPFAFQFTLNNLAQFGDLSGIADKYKISSVRIKATYNATAVQGSAVSQPFPSFMPLIRYVTDDDDSSPQTTTEINAKMGLRTKTFGNGKMIKMSCTPRVAPQVYSDVIVAYSVPSKPTWLNSSYTTVPHYGIKGYIENFSLQSNNDSTSCITFELEYKVKLKDLQ